MCIKDMAGLLTPKSASVLIDAIRQRYPGKINLELALIYFELCQIQVYRHLNYHAVFK